MNFMDRNTQKNIPLSKINLKLYVDIQKRKNFKIHENKNIFQNILSEMMSGS